MSAPTDRDAPTDAGTGNGVGDSEHAGNGTNEGASSGNRAGNGAGSAPARHLVLSLSCPDRPGIVHAVTGLLANHGGNITESQQFGDAGTGLFFMRVQVETQADPADIEASLRALADAFHMHWTLDDVGRKMRTLILVSKEAHCLTDLLFRQRNLRLPIEVVGIVGNHPDLEPIATFYGAPFHHVPVTTATKPGAEARLLDLVAAKDVELAVKHILELMSEALASGERIEIRGFGSFSLHYRPPRMGRNPKTGEAVALAGKNVATFYGAPFHHLPVTPATKPESEARLLELVAANDVELVVLARYMQILSNDLCTRLAGRIINIHHSFLPSFKGARPYAQAHARGVKLIGATAHYVTADLDEGPIIEQDVVRVSHTDDVRELVAVGQDVERRVLARAVRWHAEHRVFVNGSRTVVFR